MLAIRTTGLTKWYGTNRILDAVTTEIPRGMMTCVTGASGCGKSTFLSVIGLLQPYNDGKLEILGHQTKGMSMFRKAHFRRRHFAFVFQDFALIPNYTLLENVMQPLLYRGHSHRTASHRALALLDMLGIAHLRNRHACESSGGEQQRIGLARAMIANPSILFADEPTGNLDTANARLILTYLREVIDTFGTTVVVVTHDQDVAKKGDRLIRLS